DGHRLRRTCLRVVRQLAHAHAGAAAGVLEPEEAPAGPHRARAGLGARRHERGFAAPGSQVERAGGDLAARELLAVEERDALARDAREALVAGLLRNRDLLIAAQVLREDVASAVRQAALLLPHGDLAREGG